MTFDPVTPRLERGCRAAATPRFETGAAAYRWLNDLIAVGSAVRRADAVVLDFHAVARPTGQWTGAPTESHGPRGLPPRSGS